MGAFSMSAKICKVRNNGAGDAGVPGFGRGAAVRAEQQIGRGTHPPDEISIP